MGRASPWAGPSGPGRDPRRPRGRSSPRAKPSALPAGSASHGSVDAAQRTPGERWHRMRRLDEPTLLSHCGCGAGNPTTFPRRPGGCPRPWPSWLRPGTGAAVAPSRRNGAASSWAGRVRCRVCACSAPVRPPWAAPQTPRARSRGVRGSCGPGCTAALPHRRRTALRETVPRRIVRRPRWGGNEGASQIRHVASRWHALVGLSNRFSTHWEAHSESCMEDLIPDSAACRGRARRPNIRSARSAAGMGKALWAARGSPRGGSWGMLNPPLANEAEARPARDDPGPLRLLKEARPGPAGRA